MLWLSLNANSYNGYLLNSTKKRKQNIPQTFIWQINAEEEEEEEEWRIYL